MMTKILKQPESKKCVPTNVNNTVLFVQLPLICPSGKIVKRHFKK